MNIKLLFIIPIAGILLLSCDSDNNDSSPELDVAFSLGVSDAVVDDADEVNIEIDAVTVIIEGQDDVVINSFDGNETVKINLLDFPGSEQLTIISEDDDVVIPVGTHSLELLVVDSGSYVLLIDDPQQYSIKVPSSRLRLGEFDVVLGAAETENGPAYTVEFDLDKSLVQRGNDPAKNGFIIKPHGVRIVSSASSGTIAGNIDMDAFMAANPGCDSINNMIYLYKGSHVDAELGMLTDNVDLDDEEYPVDAPKPSDAAILPFASTPVMMNEDQSYSYEIGFVPNGDSFDGGENTEEATYTVAFACGASDQDDAIVYDQLVIANPDTEIQEVIVVTGETVMADFPKE
ncbi:DUF4382 domain-containing protein [Thalassomonas sp. M1454]|uniref:DUF4382 domain-containing protein n=1 Tax=Thalassomonas sp. M1454 TaxID=2594477 RepID=UPI00117C1A8F|nr:DUF4382 domain-containing protein [Thalassomonas sp. M1454]TRX57330.1 DUF4382 domain-containing protein [Thalassomonas sp. M1454]